MAINMKRGLVLVVSALLVLAAFASILLLNGLGERKLEKRIVLLTQEGPQVLPAKGGNPGPPDKPGKPDEGKGGYETYGRGVKWKTLPIQLVIDPDNEDGVSQEVILEEIGEALQEWDSQTSSALFDYTYTIDAATWDDVEPDTRNEIVWGDSTEYQYLEGKPNVIAVTVVWGYFSGPPSWREIVEFDILFNDDYTWGVVPPSGRDDYDNTLTGEMDIRNIATHELGHGLGLKDLYDFALSEMTMFGYATGGEDYKQTLAWGDINGIQDLYAS